MLQSRIGIIRMDEDIYIAGITRRSMKGQRIAAYDYVLNFVFVE